MSYHMVAQAPCFMCGNSFLFDVDRVTSVLIDPENGLPPDLGGDPRRAQKEPLCPPCCGVANVERAKRGLALLDERDSMDAVWYGDGTD